MYIVTKEGVGMPREKKSSIKVGLIITSVILIVMAASVFAAYKNYNDSIYRPLSGTDNASSVEITIDINNVRQLPETLYNEGLIRNKDALKIYLKLSGQGSRLKAGKYELTTAMSAYQMIDKIVKGEVKKDTVRVTIPEGFTINDIAALMESKGFGSKDKFIETAQNTNFDFDFLKNLPKRSGKIEGYLFPDTYDFPKNATPEQIIKRMLMRFEEIFDEEMQRKAADRKMTIDQVVTVASMIEKEAKIDKERPVIARVIYNRIDKKMPLQIDATVQYSLGQWKERLTVEDTKVNSPYNTYKVTGLPIGPISNPGKASLEAAVNPDDNNYLYYVYKFDDSKTHAFSANYQDFLKDKQKYIK